MSLSLAIPFYPDLGCCCRLFEDHAELINFFEKFRRLRSRDQQAESLELAEHASIVMNSLDEGIKALEDMDYFFSLLHQIGGAHTRVPGFKKEFFWVRPVPHECVF